MKIREHVHKVSKPRNFAASQEIRGPKGPGVPTTAVQMPKRVGSKVRPPKIKSRG